MQVNKIRGTWAIVPLFFYSLVAFGALLEQEAKPRHFKITPPFFIEAVEAKTNLPNFLVIKTSDNTFDVVWDYIFPPPPPYPHASIKLWVKSRHDEYKRYYMWFVSDKEGIQIIESVGCLSNVERVDEDNYRFTFE